MTTALTGGDLPSHIALHVDKDMKVTTADGTSVTKELAELCKDIFKSDAIPLIRVDDAEEAAALADYLTEKSLKDVMVVSTDIDAVAHVTQNTQGPLGVYDVSAQTKRYTEEELGDLMGAANAHDIKVILLSAASADYSSVRWLQTRLMTVWAAVDGTDAIENYTVLTNGVDGVVTGNYANIKTALSSFTGTSVLLRMPTIVGHRGSEVGSDGSVIPENTVDSLLQAAAYGVDSVELDMLPTKDGVLVLQHDQTTNEMMQSNVTITSTNYADLKDILYKQEYSHDKDGNLVERKISTMEEVFQAFVNNKEVTFFLEMKSVSSDLEKPMVTELKRLIDKYGVADQYVLLSEDTGVLAAAREIFPEASVLYVKKDITQPISDTILAVESMNAGIGPKYTMVNEASYGLYMRGVTIDAWTPNGSALDKQFVRPTFQALTTDTSDKITTWADHIELKSSTIEVPVDTAIDFGASVVNKLGAEIEDAAFTPVLISGTALEEQTDGTYSIPSGSAVVMLKYATSTGGYAYTLYSNPITIESKAPATNPNEQVNVTTTDTTEELAFSFTKGQAYKVTATWASDPLFPHGTEGLEPDHGYHLC